MFHHNNYLSTSSMWCLFLFTRGKTGGHMKFVGIGTLLGFLLICGCAVTKDWSATGGSRADGIVQLSYEVGEFEQPQLDELQAFSLATERCTAWGYTGAEAFGGVRSRCNDISILGCVSWLVTKEYQCTGSVK
jgi:hypothetical protein